MKYLSDCLLKYGNDRMKKHAESIWSAIKQIIFNARLDPTISLASEFFYGSQALENDAFFMDPTIKRHFCFFKKL